MKEERQDEDKRPSEYANELFNQGYSSGEAAKKILAKYGNRKETIDLKDVNAIGRSHPLGKHETKWKILLYIQKNGESYPNLMAPVLERNVSSVSEACKRMKCSLLEQRMEGRRHMYSLTKSGEYWLKKAKDYYNMVRKRKEIKQKEQSLGNVLRSKMEKPED